MKPELFTTNLSGMHANATFDLTVDSLEVQLETLVNGGLDKLWPIFSQLHTLTSDEDSDVTIQRGWLVGTLGGSTFTDGLTERIGRFTPADRRFYLSAQNNMLILATKDGMYIDLPKDLDLAALGLEMMTWTPSPQDQIEYMAVRNDHLPRFAYYQMFDSSRQVRQLALPHESVAPMAMLLGIKLW